MAGVLVRVLNTRFSVLVVILSSMWIRWWWNCVQVTPVAMAMFTQSCTHCSGVDVYPAYMAGLSRIPRAAITPGGREIMSQ